MITTLDLLDPKNDFVFKRLFDAAPALLTDLINAIRHPEPPITVVAILNPRIDPAELAGKYIVLDLLARDAEGHLYNVEMQVRRQPDWQARSVLLPGENSRRPTAERRPVPHPQTGHRHSPAGLRSVPRHRPGAVVL